MLPEGCIPSLPEGVHFFIPTNKRLFLYENSGSIPYISIVILYTLCPKHSLLSQYRYHILLPHKKIQPSKANQTGEKDGECRFEFIHIYLTTSI